MPNYTFRKIWDKRKRQNMALMDSGRCQVDFRYGTRRFQVLAPYSQEFVKMAHRYDGSFRKRTKVWTFRKQFVWSVISECRKMYGTDKVIILGQPDSKVACPHKDVPCGTFGRGPCSLCGGHSRHGDGCKNTVLQLIDFRQCNCTECTKCPKRIV